MPAPIDARLPQALRGLAHPLRVRILAQLREQGASTATRLADRLDESSAATSYHLRRLAAYGFVEDEPGRGAGRERWWRAATRATAEAPADAEHHLRAIAAADFQRVQDFLSVAGGLPPEWYSGVAVSNVALRMTPAQATELLSRLGALLTGYPADDPDQPALPGSERVIFQWQAFPLPAPPRDDRPRGDLRIER
ncbi:ArsR/SmtB family transcription factor [Actinoplanes teichomyceticus]|uniref:DNA-binding transcriptional ArsR family regulator n=1 Tax=Actinoplanes teichomyceticus TaxID=1867 RepID=A0A561WJE8_ACTTI|nr:helix-turn-helix domain-containing protein [Actinoplanes teichomyceticus]TWG23999.1 DNA-binding transcriptional ArsR family regulator [Actinoplanes teichomyceticus]GIF12041.1 hypothetical protein Ate01nite_20730 [Actinoplanes teichomyceticus]